jgi:hypothetical protein
MLMYQLEKSEFIKCMREYEEMSRKKRTKVSEKSVLDGSLIGGGVSDIYRGCRQFGRERLIWS